MFLVPILSKDNHPARLLIATRTLLCPLRLGLGGGVLGVKRIDEAGGSGGGNQSLRRTVACGMQVKTIVILVESQ